MQSVFGTLAKSFQLFQFPLERTCLGSVVEAVVGKAAIAAAVIGAIQILKSADARTNTARQGKLHS
jgi:hexokinase